MRSRALTYIAVGVLALAVAFALYRSILYIRKGGVADGTTLVAYFSDATGLVEKSRVQIAGLNVGQIGERKFVDQPPRPELVAQKRFARIQVVVERDAPIYENAVIFKRSASLLGEFYLEIDPGTVRDPSTAKDHRRLKDGDEIRQVREAVTTDDILRRIDETLPTMRDIAADIRELTKPGGAIPNIANNIDQTISENRENIRNVLDNLEVVTGNLRQATMGAGKDVREIIDNVRETTREVRNMVTQPEGDVKVTLDKLATAVDRMNEVLENVADITGTIRKGEGNLGRLVKDDALIAETENTIREAGDFVRSVTRLQTIVGLRSEYNIRAETLKSYVQLRIMPRPDKYYLIEFVDDPRGNRDVTEIVEETDDPMQPPRVRTLRTEVSDAFRFTFQFAKILTFSRLSTTFRFGIKESTGGLGFDVSYRLPGQQSIDIENDLFDVSANRFPRIKSMLAWEFFRHLFLVGGVDDILNDRPAVGAGSGRDYFAGLQLRFNDEDLRGLLFVGGSTVSGAAAQ